LRVSVSLEGKPLFQCAVTVGRRFQSSAPRFRSSAARFRPLRRDLGRSMDVSVQFLSHHLLQIQVSNCGSIVSPSVWCITDRRSMFPSVDRSLESPELSGQTLGSTLPHSRGLLVRIQ